MDIERLNEIKEIDSESSIYWIIFKLMSHLLDF